MRYEQREVLLQVRLLRLLQGCMGDRRGDCLRYEALKLGNGRRDVIGTRSTLQLSI